MRIFRPKAHRDLEKSGNELLNATAFAEGKETVSAILVDDTLYLHITGTAQHSLAEKAQRLEALLIEHGIQAGDASDYEQLRATSDIRDMCGDASGRVSGSVKVPVEQNGGIPSLTGKLHDVAVQLLVETARGTSFRDRLTAEPKVAGQAR